MAISRDEVDQIAKAAADKVFEGLHRYAVNYQEPQSIEGGLRESMIEESTAADWYRRRGMAARLEGDQKTADLYEHIADEEDLHRLEFKERVDALLEAVVTTE